MNVFAELSLILAIGTIVSLFMRLIKQPLLIGYILTGIVAGPSLINLHGSAEIIEVLADFGIALLLFIVGLGLNPRVIKELGRVSIVTGAVQVLSTTLIGALIMISLGQSWKSGIIVGVAIAFSSTIVGLKILSDKKEHTRLYGRIAIGVLLVQDILATIALLLLSAQSDGFSVSVFASLVLKGLAIGVPLFLVSNKLLPRFNTFIAGSQEFLFLFAIAWGFGIGALFELIGFSVEIGALIAGVCLASLPYAQEVGARLRPVRDLFIIIFFISLGSSLSLESVLEVAPLALLISAAVIIVNPITILVPLRMFGHTMRNSYKVGVMMAQISEFSLIFAVLAKDLSFINQDTLTMLTLVALITIALSCYMMIYDDELFSMIQRHFAFMHTDEPSANDRKHHYEIMLFGYRKGGQEFARTFHRLQKSYVVVDYDPHVEEAIEHSKHPFVFGDAADPELLEELGADRAKLIVVSIDDMAVQTFMLDFLAKNNPEAIVICHADSIEDAAALYERGASYVMLPHYIGSEKISAFIRKNGISKSQFKKFREKHLQYLQTHTGS